jgi:hypothetical protein
MTTETAIKSVVSSRWPVVSDYGLFGWQNGAEKKLYHRPPTTDYRPLF